MREVYKALDGADVIVFAAPLYFYSWPAQIKPVWDRLIPYYMPNSKIDMRGRRAVLLATAGDDSDTCFDGLRKSFELACAYCKWEIIGMICATDVYEFGAIAAKGDWLAKAESLGGNI
jgi:multimeric flavodoxin WrbA